MSPSSENKMEALILQTGTAFAAHLFISNQQKIKRTLAKEWSNIVPMLEVKIGKILQDRMAPTDIVIRKGPLNYYLICYGRDETESTSHLERLAARLCDQIFLKDPLLEDLQISLFVFPVVLGDYASPAVLKKYLFEYDDSQGWSLIVGRHNYASCRPEQINNKLIRQISGLRSVCDSFFLKLGPMPEENEDLEPHRAALARIAEATKIVNLNIGKLLDNHAALPAGVSVSVAKPAAIETVIAPDALQSELAATVGDHAELVYFPVWDIKQQLVNSYRATILRHLPARTVELNCGAETDVAAHLIDGLIVQKIEQDNSPEQDPSETSTFILPLHINTLQSAVHFQKIELRLKALSLVQRRRLKIEVIGATHNTIFETIKMLVAKIKIYCASVGYRLPAGTAPTVNFKKAGISSVGFHIADLIQENMYAPREIEKLATLADQLNLASFVYGVDSIAEAATSIGSGIKFISGNTIGNALEIPWGTLPFEVESLYTRVLSS